MFASPITEWFDWLESSAGLPGLLLGAALVVCLGWLLYAGLFKLVSSKFKEPFLYAGPILQRYVYLSGLVALVLLLGRVCLPLFYGYLSEKGGGNFKQAFQVSIILALTVLFIRLINALREIFFQYYKSEETSDFRARKVRTQLIVIERVVTFLIALAGISFALMSFEKIRALGQGLLASAGIIGIILGFAAQKTIATVIAGVQIALAQPIRIGDVVIVEGDFGWIEEITLTFVVVRVWDERRIVLPVTHFIDKPFQNWTRTTTELLGTVFLYVDYRMPVEPLREELTRILEETPLWDGRANGLIVFEANERGMQLRALVSAKDAPTAWDLRCLVREKLIAYIRENYPDFLPRARVQLESDPEDRATPI